MIAVAVIGEFWVLFEFWDLFGYWLCVFVWVIGFRLGIMFEFEYATVLAGGSTGFLSVEPAFSK